MRMHALEVPAAISTARAPPETGTGADRVIIGMPIPSWPLSFDPQHVTVPSSSCAHEASRPAATCTAGPVNAILDGDGTTSGPPGAVCQESLRPQHHTPPLPSTAHVWPFPVATSRIA